MVKRAEPQFGDGLEPVALNGRRRFTASQSIAHRLRCEPAWDWRRLAAPDLYKLLGRDAVPTFFWGGSGRHGAAQIIDASAWSTWVSGAIRIAASKVKKRARCGVG